MQKLKALYDRYKGAVFGYLYRMTDSPQEAEELTQETFYQALLSLHRFRAGAPVLPWLLRIARNVYLKRLRRRGRERATPHIDEVLHETTVGPEQALIRLDEWETVRRALARLPEQYRTVLVHRARQRLRGLYLEEENP